MLGMGPIPAFDISASCCGFVYALAIAANFVETGFYRHVLIIAADVMTRLVDFSDRSTCVLFGDAAGAAVIGPAEREGQEIIYSRLSADGGRAPLIWAPGGGSREPTSQKTLNEKLHLVKMRGREVYKFAVTQMQEVTQDALEQCGLSLDDVAMVIPHQSNLRIIESARDKLHIPPEKMYINIQRTGNTSAASVPIALDELRQAGRLKAGDVVVMVAFGAGLTWASGVVRL
jgi:3-oxoacyl-[acyl-carrier-protein] synthase-3